VTIFSVPADRYGPFAASLALARRGDDRDAARVFMRGKDMMALDRQTIDPATLDELVGKAVSELAAGYGGVMIDIGRKLGP
jgi:hypothetical protein